jgi:RNA polymerase sigma-70 factor (ECF subfamily)
VPGAALAAVLAQNAASAGVPASVVASTVKAAGWFAAGQAAGTGVISVQVAALTEEVLKTMLLSKIKVALAVLLTVAALSGVAALICFTRAAEPPGAPQANEGPKAPKTEGADREKQTRDDLDRLQGTWEVTEVVFDGKPVDGFQDASAVFDKDKMSLIGQGGKKEYRIKLDPSKKPRAIDLTSLDGEFEGSNPAIYQLDGDTLKLCMFNEPGNKKRPTEVASNEGSKLLLMTFQKNPLIGSWECTKVEGQEKAPHWRIEFLNQGRFRMKTTNAGGKFEVEGTYTLKKDKLTVTVEKDGKTLDTQTYAIQTLMDEALIYLDHHRKLEFRRAK